MLGKSVTQPQGTKKVRMERNYKSWWVKFGNNLIACCVKILIPWIVIIYRVKQLPISWKSIDYGLKSFLVDQLRNWCLKCQQGGSRNHPCMQPHWTDSSGEIYLHVPYPILTCICTHNLQGQEGWEQEYSMIHREISYCLNICSQRSVRICSKCKWCKSAAKQHETCGPQGNLQAPEVTLHVMYSMQMGVDCWLHWLYVACIYQHKNISFKF